MKLVDGQILFTCAGTVGNVTLISREYEEILCDWKSGYYPN